MEFKIRKTQASRDAVGQTRIKWPWKDMAVGDEVDIPADLAGRGQTSAHVYGRAVGKKFGTRTMENGELLVWRLS